MKNVYKIIKLHKDHNKGLKVKHIMYLLKKLTRLYYVLVLVNDWNHLIE